jgi:hypothetical protein
MNKRLEAILVLTLSIGAIGYAVNKSGLSPFTVYATWEQGCCITSNDCSGQKICYSSGYPSGWAGCGGYVPRDDGGNGIMIEANGYCNTASDPQWN